MKRRVSAALYLVVLSVLAGSVWAETVADCSNKSTEQLKAAEAEAMREWQACHEDHQCVVQAQARRHAAQQQIYAAYAACHARAMPPQPAVHWKPGDPSPVAPDGRRYIMSCSGKVLGLYKPGGALEVELQSRPGNCIPRDDWGPGGFGPGTGKSSTERCWDATTSQYKDYSGTRPSGCVP